MKEDPRKYWDNIPNEVDAPMSDEADVPRIHTLADRIQEEKEAEQYNDND